MKMYRLLLWALLGPAFFFSHRALATPSCSWQGATVKVDEWLECKNCVWQYCQCLPSGRWGYCTNTPPDKGACDWTNPDWQNPACIEGGTKPCDWTNPDWQNPECQNNTPPGGNQPCVSCHSPVPTGTPPPPSHIWAR